MNREEMINLATKKIADNIVNNTELIMKYLMVLFVLTLTACSTTEEYQPSGYLPHDPLVLECVEGKKVVKNSRGQIELEGDCEE